MITVKFSGTARATFANSARSVMRVSDMNNLGNFAVSTVRQRAARGLGSDGAPMAPLRSDKVVKEKTVGNLTQLRRIGYAAWKSRKGLQPTRDLIGDGSQGGHMWDNFSVRSVSETLVRMAFTKKHQREKALANEKRSPFLSFSPADQVKIVAEASRLFSANVRNLGVTAALAAFRKRAA